MKRIITALVLIPLFVYLTAFSPQWLFLVSLATVAALCFHEYSGLVALHNIPPPGVFGYVAGLVVLLLPLGGGAFLVLVAILGLALSLRSREMADALPYAGAMLLGVVYVFGTLRCAVDLRDINRYWLLFALSLNWVGDIAAFYAGRTMGRHRLASNVSPGKTWEGSAASVLATILYAAAYAPRLLPEMPFWEALAVAALANVAGQIGDLSESAMKRGAGVKDSGTLLPGHGGWLDRLDSSLFALPVTYFLVSHLATQHRP